MKTYLVSFLLMVFSFNYSILLSEEPTVETTTKLLSQKEYYDAVYASWIGQIIGNTYGLGYEFKFIDNPGPDKFPYGYSFTINDLRKHNGAYSDDDTDIEYMYLIEMEKWGIEPNYFHLAEAWKAHVKERIWFANRMAVTLMHAGHYPPVTGMIGHNSEWFQIDPQLVNEIWAITSPGMIDYTVEKTEFAARITSDSFGLEPTLHYAAMFSAAFFEKDVNKLIDIGTSKLLKGSRFATIVEHVKELYKTYPNDWQKAREIVKSNYYVVQDYNRHSWAAVDANMNGALGIMALLYGQGDFQKTLNYCCAFGMDADNQAATMCGLLGIVNGFKSIPTDLMYPIKDANWSKPFNDTYKMITREGLPDALISDMAKRTALQGEKIIMANGGRIVNKNGENYYEIETSKGFSAPFELNPIPNIVAEVNKSVSYPLYTGGARQNVSVNVTGNLPNGIQVTQTGISGTPTQPGDYKFDITATCESKQKTISVNIKIFAENLAPTASKILFNTNAKNQDIELIRDGKKDKTYYSKKNGNTHDTDFYGYEWATPQEITAIEFNNGASQEFGGWFTSFDVEYLQNGKWTKIENIAINPKLNTDNSQWLKPAFMDFLISFPKIETNGIRIIGLSGGIEKDAANAYLGIEYYTSIAELAVYGK